jgi:hypothetical protein
LELRDGEVAMRKIEASSDFDVRERYKLLTRRGGISDWWQIVGECMLRPVTSD